MPSAHTHGHLQWFVLACCVLAMLVCVHFDTVCCAYHNLSNKQQATYAAYALSAYSIGMPGCHCCKSFGNQV